MKLSVFARKRACSLDPRNPVWLRLARLIGLLLLSLMLIYFLQHTAAKPITAKGSKPLSAPARWGDTVMRPAGRSNARISISDGRELVVSYLDFIQLRGVTNRVSQALE